MKFEVSNPEHMTKYEKARVLGSRALQIAQGAPLLIDVTQEEIEKLKYNPVELAKLELKAGVLPITVQRPMPRGVHEE